MLSKSILEQTMLLYQCHSANFLVESFVSLKIFENEHLKKTSPKFNFTFPHIRTATTIARQ